MTPREAVKHYAKSVKATIGKVVSHGSFSSVVIHTRPRKRVEIWKLPAGRLFVVYSGQRFVGETKSVSGMAKLLKL